MRLNELRIQEIQYRLRDGNLLDDDVLDLIESHESLREDLSKVQSGNMRLWKENEELKGNLKVAVNLILTTCTDEQLNCIKELGELARLEIAKTMKEGRK